MSNPPGSFDQSIPVLTEVLDDAAAAAPDTAAGVTDHGLAQRTVQGWTDAEWDALELRLSERILTQLQNRTDFVLEQRVRDAMAEVLQHALKSLTAEIRDGLHDTLEKIVARAVTQELTHLKALRK
jgi:hypothetical protein